LKFTRQDLANRVKVDLSTISRYESGERVPDLMAAYELVRGLEWSLNDMMKDIIYRDRNGSD
jgi:transcriptional regulator with XRE-family HTH domain